MLLKRGEREEVGKRQGAKGTRSTRRDTGNNEKGITICSSASNLHFLTSSAYLKTTDMDSEN